MSYKAILFSDRMGFLIGKAIEVSKILPTGVGTTAPKNVPEVF
jgi:hypothetical protein